MPILKENKHRYPMNWKNVRAMVLARAKMSCEGSPKYPGCRARQGQPHPVTGKPVYLSIAHLDHTPENSKFGNLRAMCQRCHTSYDAKHHAETRKSRVNES